MTLTELIENLEQKHDRVRYHGEEIELVFLDELLTFLREIDEDCITEYAMEEAREEAREEANAANRQNVRNLFEKLKK